MSSAAEQTRRTRLTPEREQEIYDVTLKIVREAGYDALTMDKVAARTKSSKATLYRQWESKPKLVVSALRHRQQLSTGDIDTGTLADDLRELVRRAGAKPASDMELTRGMAHAIFRDQDLHDALRGQIVDPEIRTLDTMLNRAVARGELATDNPAAGFTVHMLLGAMTARQLIENKEPDEEFLVHYVEAVVLPALGLV